MSQRDNTTPNWNGIKEGMTLNDASEFLATNPGPKKMLELIVKEFDDCPYIGLILRNLYHSGIPSALRQRPETGSGCIKQIPSHLKPESAKLLRVLCLYLCVMHREQVKSIIQLSAMQPPPSIVITKETLDDPRLLWIKDLPQVKEVMERQKQSMKS